MAFHAGIALREAVTVIRVAGDVAEQLVHGFIKVFVAVIGASCKTPSHEVLRHTIGLTEADFCF